MLTHTAPTVPARPWSPPTLPSRPWLQRPSWPALIAAVALVAGIVSLTAQSPAPVTHPQVGPLPSGAGAAGLPVRFEANLGQTGASARFLARAGATTLFLADREIVLSRGKATVSLGLVGSQPASIVGAGELPGITNYYVGDDPAGWVRGVPSYAAVRYEGLHPGIDLVVHARRGPLEYDYEVASGADPGAIAFEVSGATATSLDAGGALVMAVEGGEFRQNRPVAYQEIGGRRVPVDAAFVLDGTRVSFRLGAYDHSHTLVIDPTLGYATFLGGAGFDEGRSVAVDASGNSYIAGWTNSTDFPAVPAEDPNSDGHQLAFVTKLNASGSAIVYSNYFGGSGGDKAAGVALRGGDAFVVGETSSTDFPTTGGAFTTKCGVDGNCDGGPDSFVTRFSASGSILYSTYLGGRGEDRANGVAIAANGTVYVTGTTNSTRFPTTAGALQPQCGADAGCGANATFLDGVSISGSTTYTSASAGFTGDDLGKEITGANIPVSTTIAGVTNGATITLSNPASASGSGLTFSIANATFTDGSSIQGSPTYTSALPHFLAGDVGKGISGQFIPTDTTIVAFNSPTSVTLSDTAEGTGSGLTFTIDRHTFVDGESVLGSPHFTSASAAFGPSDVGKTISGTNLADNTSIAEVLGPTEVTLSANATGTGSGLRFTIGRGRPRSQAKQFAFVAAFDPEGSGAGDLVYSTYLGGFGDTNGNAIALAGSDVVVTGTTGATDFPAKGAFQATKAGEWDAFVTRLAPGGGGGNDLVASTFLGGASSDSGTAIAVTSDAIYVTGETRSDNYPVQGGLTTPCKACDSEADAFVTKLTADVSSLQYSTYLAGAGFDGGAAIAVDAGGGAVVAGTTYSSDFPVVSPVLFDGADDDAFVAKLNPDGASLVYSTYLGSGGSDTAYGVALTATGQPVVVGRTGSAGFLSTAGSLDPSCGADGTCSQSQDAFVVRLAPGTLPALAKVDPPGGPLTVATAVQITGAGFTGATAVKFGDQTATFTVVNDGLINAFSPPRDESIDVEVTVTGPDGISLPNLLTRFRYGEGLFTPTAPCTIFRCGSNAILLPTGKVLAASAEGGRPAELFDPLTGTWSPTGSCTSLPGTGNAQSCTTGFPGMPMALITGTPSTCGTNCGKVLVSGGYGSGTQTDPNLTAAFLYEPATGTWRRTGDMTQPRVNHSITALPDGTVLVAGGCQIRFRGCGPSGGAALLSAEIYNPLNETWTATTPMGAARAVHPAILLDPAVGPCGSFCGKVLVAGGVNNGAQQDTAEVYDPVAKTWSVAAPLNVARYAYPAVQVVDGTVLAIGSYGGAAPTNEYLDLAADEWTQLADLPFQSGSDGDAVRLPNGKVLSLPGSSSSPDRGGAQLYDPATRTWAATGPQTHPRNNQHMVLLPKGPSSVCGTNCGKVLIAGANSDDPGTSAELYTPRPTVTSIVPLSVPAVAGGSITVTGTGLTTVDSVRFGSVPGANLAHDAETPDTKLTVTVPAQAVGGTVDVTVAGPAGRSVVTAASKLTLAVAQTTTTTTTTTTTISPGASRTTPPTTASPITGPAPAGEQGYAMTASDGGVFTFGTLPFAGSLGNTRPARPAVGIEHTPSGRGYWLVAADGGVFAFGDAPFLGSTGGIRLAQPIVGMRATPSGRGYWLVGADGGTFAFGDARFFGSTGGIRLRSPIVGMERSGSGNGYWLVGADGGVFAFGDAPFRGSTGGMRLVQPVVAITRSAAGAGYLLVGADGGVFAFGDAVFRGSTGALRLASPIVGVARTAAGGGYWLCARDGGVFTFGNAGFAGSLGATRLNAPIVGCSSRP